MFLAKQHFLRHQSAKKHLHVHKFILSRAHFYPGLPARSGIPQQRTIGRNTGEAGGENPSAQQLNQGMAGLVHTDHRPCCRRFLIAGLLVQQHHPVRRLSQKTSAAVKLGLHDSCGATFQHHPVHRLVQLTGSQINGRKAGSDQLVYRAQYGTNSLGWCYSFLVNNGQQAWAGLQCESVRRPVAAQNLLCGACNDLFVFLAAKRWVNQVSIAQARNLLRTVTAEQGRLDLRKSNRLTLRLHDVGVRIHLHVKGHAVGVVQIAGHKHQRIVGVIYPRSQQLPNFVFQQVHHGHSVRATAQGLI